MPLFLLALFLLSSWIPWIDLSSLSKTIHYQCLEAINFKSPVTPIYEALICGKKLPQNSLKEIFVKGGIIHLMVVSGAHLLFLEKIWMQIPLPSKIKSTVLYFLLSLYALGTQLHPPVIRALFSFCLFRFSRSKKLFLSPTFITHFSSLLCLLYNPYWIYSSSLQLSWLASLSQNLKGLLKKSFWTYLILFPLVNRWQTLHPLTVIINWLIAPIIGGCLFPLSFLSFIFKPFHLITDKLWTMTFTILQWLCFWDSKSILFKWSFSQTTGWIYLIVVLSIFYLVETYRRQNFYKKSKLSRIKKRYQLRWKPL